MSSASGRLRPLDGPSGDVELGELETEQVGDHPEAPSAHAAGPAQAAVTSAPHASRARSSRPGRPGRQALDVLGGERPATDAPIAAL